MYRNALSEIPLEKRNSLRGGVVQKTVTSSSSVAAILAVIFLQFLCKSPPGSLHTMHCIAHCTHDPPLGFKGGILGIGHVEGLDCVHCRQCRGIPSIKWET